MKRWIYIWMALILLSGITIGNSIFGRGSNSPIRPEEGTTTLIAASNSTAAARDLAGIYVCDGSTCEVTIREAINTKGVTHLSVFSEYGSAVDTLASYNINFYNPDDDSDDASPYKMICGNNLYTSSDGITWSAGSALNVNGGTAIATSVGCAWNESGTWYLLDRDDIDNDINLYTSADDDDPTSWTEDGGNPCLEPSETWENDEVLDPCAVIKVGATYYLYYNNVNTDPRETGVATSANLTAWTKNARNPIFTGNRFCPTVWKGSDSNYYMMICHFSSHHHAEGGNHAYEELELYRDDSPTFYPEEREFLGVVYTLPTTGWNIYNIDTPQVFTEDIARTTYATTGMIEIAYYAATSGGAAKSLGRLTATETELAALSAGSMGGIFVFAPGTYTLDASVYLRENTICYADGAVFAYNVDYSTEHGAIYMATNSRLIGGEIKNVGTTTASGLCFVDGIRQAYAEGLIISDFEYGVYALDAGGSIKNCAIYDSTDDGIHLTNGRNFRAEGCSFEQATNQLISCGAATYGTVADNCRFIGGTDGFYTANTAYNNLVSNSYFIDQSGDAIEFSAGSGNGATGNYVTAAGTKSVYITCTYNYITNNMFEDSTRIVINSDYNRLIGNYIDNCDNGTTQSVVFGSSANDCIIANNVIVADITNGLNIQADDDFLVMGNWITGATVAILDDTDCNTNQYKDNIPPFGQTVTAAAPAIYCTGYTFIDTTNNDVAATLADATYEGTQKIITLTDATEAADGGTTVTVAHHFTGDAVAFTFDDVGDTLILEWSGSDWYTVSSNFAD